MSYCTYDDLVLAFGENEVVSLSDRDRDGLPDDGVLEEAIAFADSHIDGYLRERYDVPLANCPSNIKGFACDFARYRLYQDQPTDLVQERYNVGCFFLKDVARGMVQLNTSDTYDTHIAYSQPEAVFTRLVW
jgi:phage gp36-like protein